MATSKCLHCNQAVYPLERMVLADKVFHKGCAKCAHCQGTLSISNFATANGKLYCKPHYLGLFKASGGKYAFDTAGDAEATSAPQPTPSKEATPSKRISRVSSLFGSSSGEKDKSARKEPNKWVKDMFNRGNKSEKAPAEKVDRLTNKRDQSVAETPIEKQPEVPKKLQASALKAFDMPQYDLASIVDQFTERPKESIVQVEDPVYVESEKREECNSLPMDDKSQPETVEVESKSADQAQPERVENPTKVTQATKHNKLAVFLSHTEVTKESEMMPPVASNVESVAPEPIVQSVPKVETVQHINQKPVESHNRLSMFLSQYTNPSETIPSAPVSVTKAREQPKPAFTIEEEKQASVHELLKKTEAKQGESKPLQDRPRPVTPRKAKEVTKVPVASSPERKPTVLKTPGKDAQGSEIEKLRTELEKSRARCKELEAENEALRARIDLSVAGKEALAQEVARLTSALESVQPGRPHADENHIKPNITMSTGSTKAAGVVPEASIDSSLKHAKKLLAQGKITKAQYEAAAKACAEASKVVQTSGVTI